MNNDKVVERFIYGLPGKSLSMRTDGRRLFSYDTVIAQVVGNVIVLNITKYSKTTSQHQTIVKIYSKGKLVGNVYNIPRGTQDLTAYPMF